MLARTPLEGRAVGGLLPHGGGVVAATVDGEVWSWGPPGPPRRLGELGGRLREGVAKVSDRTVVGVVEGERVVAFDLSSGATTLLLSVASVSAQLEDTVTLTSRGSLIATSVLGEFVAVDNKGLIVERGALEALPTTVFGADAGVPAFFQRVKMQSSPPLITDSEGRIAFARNSGKVGIVDRAGKLQTATSRQCARPIAILPAGPARFVVACRSGSVAMFGDT